MPRLGRRVMTTSNRGHFVALIDAATSEIIDALIAYRPAADFKRQENRDAITQAWQIGIG